MASQVFSIEKGFLRRTDRAYNEVMNVEINLEEYIPRKQLTTMPQIDKTICIRRIQNYLFMKRLDLNVSKPDFAFKSKLPKNGQHPNEKDTGSNWKSGRKKRNLVRKNSRRISPERTPLEGRKPVELTPFEGFRRIFSRSLLRRLWNELDFKMYLRTNLDLGFLDEDECKILDPTDKSEFEIVKKRQKEKLTNEARSRYPKRNILQKCYQELEDPSSDEYLSCEECNEQFLHGNCPVHGLPKFFQNKSIVKKVKSPDLTQAPDNPAVRSVPSCLEVLLLNGTIFGVWTREPIAKGTLFGPYRGTITLNNDSGFCWEVYKGGKLDHYVDGQDILQSNWMRYVRCSEYKATQNFETVQISGKVYYRARFHVPKKSEMMTWYGKEYLQGTEISEICDVGNILEIDLSEEMPYGRRAVNGWDKMQHGKGKGTLQRLHEKDGSHEPLLCVKLLVGSVELRKRQYKCTACKVKRGFSLKQAFKNHMKIHSGGEKPYGCPVCLMKFSLEHHLISHSIIHIGNQP